VGSGGYRGNHPDMFVIDVVAEEVDTITIDRIVPREGDADCAEAFLRLRPMEGSWRLLLIREADRMLGPAQNGLLKILEEPGPETVIVLETDRPARLLPTIRSRCAEVSFDSLSADDARAVLEDLRVEDAERLARWCGGSPGEALRLASEGAADARALLGAVLTARVSPLEASRAAWQLEGAFPGAKETQRTRARARSLLDLACAVVRDLGAHAAGVPEGELAHGDLVALAPPAARSGVHAQRAFAGLVAARRDVDAYLAPEGAVERGLLALAPAPSRA
jgi:DNA polymerase-3 subunit delta'